MTKQPKSITLQQFEELAKSFVQSHAVHYYDTMKTFDMFKAFVFKEDLEKSQRYKDFLKLKEDYLKLKDEFEPESAEDSPEYFVSENSIKYKTIPDPGNNGCDNCALSGNDCRDSWSHYDCSAHSIIWIKA